MLAEDKHLYEMKRNIKIIFFVIMIILYSVLTVAFSYDVGEYITASINNCLTVIIPSLYIFMIISGFLISTNLYKAIGQPFDLISRYIFKIPSEYFSVFLISSVAGYPVGAKLLTDLKTSNKISDKDAETMIGYCYLGGPAFFCGAVGVTLFDSIKTGIIIFVSIFLSNLVLAIIAGLSRKVPPKYSVKTEYSVTFDKLINSIISGAKSLFIICAIIVFFSSFICFADKLNVLQTISIWVSNLTKSDIKNTYAAVRTFIEISQLSKFSHGCFEQIPIITSLMSFGGLCIIMQVMCITYKKIRMKYFFICRLFSVFFSYFISKFLLSLFYYNIIVSASTYLRIGFRQSSPIPAVFLLIMTILLLFKNSVEKN